MKILCDIVIVVLLGVEEWGVVIVVLVVEGCIMMCKCYKNICFVGIVI